jgi:ribonuclease BN (tRNA processing enzyme)
MKITVIGCGNAFSKINYNQCFLLEEYVGENRRRLIIDFGAKIPMALDKLGISVFDIDDIYISHAHSDHIGGLEEIALLRYDWTNRPRRWDDFTYNHSFKADREYLEDRNYKRYAPRLISNQDMMKELWNYSLKGGLETMEGFVAELDTFFETVRVDENVPFFWMGWRFDLIWQIHVMTGSIIKHSFGLLITREGHKTVYVTTDSQHCSPKQVEIFYKKADLIFQDCECIGVDTRTKEFKFSSGVHANYAQLAGYPSANSIKLSDNIKSKMILSHYQDFVSNGLDSFNNVCDWEKFAKEDGFLGWAKVGKVYEV